jgi:antibiotic biosynthesis monooxygenase (ABM) superfamily enzyme
MRNEEWTWEASPKRQFNIKRLQRCYDAEYNSPLQKETPRDTKNMREERTQPYWNMWRAVLTGWLIRYPMVFFKMIGITVLGSFFLTLVLIGSISNTLDDSQSISEEVQRDL